MTTDTRLLEYLHQQTRAFRTNHVNGAWYLVLSAEDKECFPQLQHFFAIAFQSGSTDVWLIASEADYDEEILLGLSCPDIATIDGRTVQ